VELLGPDGFLTRIRSIKGDTSVMRNTYVCLNGCPELNPLKNILEEYFKGVHPSGIDHAHLKKCYAELERVMKSTPDSLRAVKEELKSALVLLEDFIRRGSWYCPAAEEFFLCHLGKAVLEIMGYDDCWHPNAN